MRDIHKILLQGGRGAKKQSGEFRTSQNWIDGNWPGNALFVPPALEHLLTSLGDLEEFINNTDDLPILIRAGMFILSLKQFILF